MNEEICHDLRIVMTPVTDPGKLFFKKTATQKDLEKMEDPEDLHKAAGCEIKNSDFANIVLSVIYYGIFIIYGAAVASLGAALPMLANEFNQTVSHFGFVFTARGMGFLIGAFGSAFYLNWKGAFFSKHISTALALVLSGIVLGIVEFAEDYQLVVSVYVLQGLGFGFIDTVGNCALPELWGRRVGPWMQALHSCFGVGAIIGPALVGAFGFHSAFEIIMWLSFLPWISLVVFNFWSNSMISYNQQPQQHQRLSTEADEGSEHASEKQHPIEEGEEVIEEEGKQKVPVPMYLRLLVSSFFFVYVGTETGFGGWVPAYSLAVHITEDESQAAYLSAIFWTTMTIGRIAAIPIAVYLSSTTMIRLQLFLSVISGIFILTILSINYSIAAFTSAAAGLALSSIFPVMMTIIGDYGFNMDSLSTTMYMVGATVGESILPVVIGFAMSLTGPYTMCIMIMICTLILVAQYIVIHYLSMYIIKNAKVSDGEVLDASVVDTSSHPLKFQIIAEDDDDNDDVGFEHSDNDGEAEISFNPLTRMEHHRQHHNHNQQGYARLRGRDIGGKVDDDGKDNGGGDDGIELVKITA